MIYICFRETNKEWGKYTKSRAVVFSCLPILFLKNRVFLLLFFINKEVILKLFEPTDLHHKAKTDGRHSLPNGAFQCQMKSEWEGSVLITQNPQRGWERKGRGESKRGKSGPRSACPPELSAEPGPGLGGQQLAWVTCACPELCLIPSYMLWCYVWTPIWAGAGSSGGVTVWPWPPASRSRKQHLHKMRTLWSTWPFPDPAFEVFHSLHLQRGMGDVHSTRCLVIPSFLTLVLPSLGNQIES